ncbi:hypothetical protein [Streptomyces anandii]|uniref:hypothetical protein n=1 Tax=Streptomyces anandii TaxID=285454 RepID=UPI00167B83BA|nr:hypothetical protein [Streptomyces anandii]
MSTAYVPQQPQPVRPAAPAPTTAPYTSEATRLLCAGTYLDSGYRDQVIDELYLNEQRITAPSLGFDASRVLAHALRARRLELAWDAAILGLWAVGAALSQGWLLLFLGLGLQLAIASWIRGRDEHPPLYRVVPAWVLRWYSRIGLLYLFVATVFLAFGAGDDSSGSSSPYDGVYGTTSTSSLSATDVLDPGGSTFSALQAWLSLAVLALIALCVAAQRSQVTRSLSQELSTQRFPDAAADPALTAEGGRLRRMTGRIRAEQHQPLIMYHEARPFCGAGSAYDTWVLAVELRPDAMRKQRPLTNRTVLDTVRPLLEQLRESAATNLQFPVRDRLRGLEIDECVFLPVEGLLRREDAPYQPEVFEEHRRRAVEEGAEKRRHFLRVRVGGWEEELVVSVFFRVHTQGRMLMLEVAPHVLTPVREEFKDADRLAHRYNRNSVLGKAAYAVPRVPRSAGAALAHLGRLIVFGWRLLTAGNAGALPEGPARSVRELGAAPRGSLFQEMDVDRYLRTVQDRIAHGVRTALLEAGYQTGEFVQKIVNISNGGVNIESVEDSTFAVGSHATATSGVEPQKGADGDGRPA